MNIIHEWGHNICKLIYIIYSAGGHQRSKMLNLLATKTPISLKLWFRYLWYIRFICVIFQSIRYIGSVCVCVCVFYWVVSSAHCGCFVVRSSRKSQTMRIIMHYIFEARFFKSMQRYTYKYGQLKPSLFILIHSYMINTEAFDNFICGLCVCIISCKSKVCGKDCQQNWKLQAITS